MTVALSVLQGLLLVVLAFFALGVANFVFQLGTGLVTSATLGLFGLPIWVRWTILLPAIVFSAFILIVTFNVIHSIGDWFGESFVGTAWMWGTTFIQSAVVPSLLVTTAFMIAPNGRRWIATALMLVIWTWLAGTLFDPDTGEFVSESLMFYGALLLAAFSALAAVRKAWIMEPVLRLMESEFKRDTTPADAEHYGEAVVEPQYCNTCGAKLSAGTLFCSSCGVSLRTGQ
jgi:hypothetical protein